MYIAVNITVKDLRASGWWVTRSQICLKNKIMCSFCTQTGFGVDCFLGNVAAGAKRQKFGWSLADGVTDWDFCQ